VNKEGGITFVHRSEKPIDSFVIEENNHTKILVTKQKTSNQIIVLDLSNNLELNSFNGGAEGSLVLTGKNAVYFK